MTTTVMYKSIVYRRDDGDLDLIATLNNSGEHLTEQAFRRLHHIVLGFIAEQTGKAVEALTRQDAPDVLTTDNETTQPQP
jgi:hypothetical protein